MFFEDVDSDENQIGSEGYHELSESLQISLGNEEKTHNNGKCNLVIPLSEFRA